MSPSFDCMDLEALTSNAKQIQDDVLKQILTLNANTEYLQRYLHGSSDKEHFKKNVPVITYEDVSPYIERVANGEPSNVITGNSITGFFLSSGTSGGKHKIFPMNNIFFENLLLYKALSSPFVSKYMDGAKREKEMMFGFTRPLSKTPSGLPVSGGVSSFLQSDYFKNQPSELYSSPIDVTLCPDNIHSMYCHLLCGLVQRNEITSMSAYFVSILVRAINFLETHWRELCSNTRYGHVSEWITDQKCRDSVTIILGGPNPELANFIEYECNKKSWQGIIRRLWPKVKFIDCVVTGSMTQYIPTLDFYSNKLPIYSVLYASSESIFGINVDPSSKLEDVSYTCLPNMSYFEFKQIDEENKDDIVDLVNVKLGCYYELLVTNYFGLHRYNIGDILQVTGFYNSTPQFRFIRRKETVLSIQTEITIEEHILKALYHATLVLESSNLMLMGNTCYEDISTNPGHYVFYWELNNKNIDGVELDNKVLVKCCCVMEESLSPLYKTFRSKDGSIGALEIRVVQQGTFDSLMDFFVSKGSSISQYKTPLCIKSSEALTVLEDKVLGRFFSDKCPPL
ncbi:PREDICTED: 4-substituted benzoates-glutamate ligase GH3.12-like [Camelina sativa]|uniref:4-substituted benzoates-glutamate ligase GH3.12-like n=1 Tax=Camelina sativa TaxID=90675 RepID=A0ABM0VU66_CAMSA|nr:PREDICTED: 4-substituted benzoates-glutamate ligase GH3.12-like [Camelina sativa]